MGEGVFSIISYRPNNRSTCPDDRAGGCPGNRSSHWSVGLSLLAQRPAKVVTCPWRRSS